MNVVDLLADIVLGSEIPVVSAATLPETVLTTAVRLPVRHAFEKAGTLIVDPVKGTLGDRRFDRLENPADPDAWARQQDQMDVLGHEDVAPQIVETFVASGIESFGQPEATALARQERLLLETGERQTMGLAINVVTLARFSMG